MQSRRPGWIVVLSLLLCLLSYGEAAEYKTLNEVLNKYAANGPGAYRLTPEDKFTVAFDFSMRFIYIQNNWEMINPTTEFPALLTSFSTMYSQTSYPGFVFNASSTQNYVILPYKNPHDYELLIKNVGDPQLKVWTRGVLFQTERIYEELEPEFMFNYAPEGEKPHTTHLSGYSNYNEKECSLINRNENKCMIQFSPPHDTFANNGTYKYAQAWYAAGPVDDPITQNKVGYTPAILADHISMDVPIVNPSPVSTDSSKLNAAFVISIVAVSIAFIHIIVHGFSKRAVGYVQVR